MCWVKKDGKWGVIRLLQNASELTQKNVSKELTEQDVYQALENLDNFELTKTGEMTFWYPGDDENEAKQSWKRTYQINNYGNDIFTAESTLECDSSGEFFEEELSYKDGIYYSTNSFNNTYSTPMPADEFLDISMPEKECITNVQSSKDSEDNMVFTFDLNTKAITQQNAHILRNVCEMWNIVWKESVSEAVLADTAIGYDEGTIQVTMGNEGNVKSIEITYLANIVAQEQFKGKGTTEFKFEY